MCGMRSGNVFSDLIAEFACVNSGKKILRKPAPLNGTRVRHPKFKSTQSLAHPANLLEQ